MILAFARLLTVSVRDFALCGVLQETSLSRNDESLTAARVRDHSIIAMICFAQKCNWLCRNVGCHVFRNRHRKI